MVRRMGVGRGEEQRARGECLVVTRVARAGSFWAFFNA